MRVRLESYDWIVVNTSAGKDSQAMMDYLCQRTDEASVRDRLVAVHCDLAEEEWPETKELAAKQSALYGIRFEVVKRPQGGLLQHVLDRHATLQAKGKAETPPWMSSDNRFCTSDHKRGQVSTLLTKLADESRKGVAPWPSATNRWCTSHHKSDQAAKLLTRLVRETKDRHGRNYRVRILNCMGMRAGESCARGKLLPFKLDKRNTNGKRIVHVWLPIHYAYDLGMPRLSCCFCIFAPKPALMLAGLHNPELLDRYVEVEKKTGFTFRQELPLVEVRDAIRRGDPIGEIRTWEM